MGEVLGWTLILGVVAAELVFWSWLAALGRFFRVGRSCSFLDFTYTILSLNIMGGGGYKIVAAYS
jgi:hypothetical protein